MQTERWSARVEIRGPRLVLARRATHPEYRARLVRAAQMLADVRHRSVEAFIDLIDDSATTTLLTGFVGERSLHTCPPVRIGDASALGSALVEALAEMHRQGIAHGPIAPHQVVFDPQGRPVLCDFSDGHRATDLSSELWWARTDADVRSLGLLLGDSTTKLAPAPSIRPITWLRLHRFTRLAAQLRSGMNPESTVPGRPPVRTHTSRTAGHTSGVARARQS